MTPEQKNDVDRHLNTLIVEVLGTLFPSKEELVVLREYVHRAINEHACRAWRTELKHSAKVEVDVEPES
jgi:hypothetical protein